MTGLYKLEAYDSSNGIYGTFLAELEEVQILINKKIPVNFNSNGFDDIFVLDENEIKLITKDPVLIQKLDSLGLIFGVNPFGCRYEHEDRFPEFDTVKELVTYLLETHK